MFWLINSSLPFSNPCYLLNSRSCFDSWKRRIGRFAVCNFLFKLCYMSGVSIRVQLKYINSCILSTYHWFNCFFWNWASLKSYPPVHLNFREPWSLALLSAVGWPDNPAEQRRLNLLESCSANFKVHSSSLLPLHLLCFNIICCCCLSACSLCWALQSEVWVWLLLLLSEACLCSPKCDLLFTLLLCCLSL